MRKTIALAVFVLVASGSWPCRAAPPERASDDDSEFEFVDRLFVPRWRLTDGPQVRAAFRDVVKDSARSVVVIRCEKNQLALGGVVAPDGWILTKATPLCGQVVCQLADGRELPAVTVGTNPAYDLALLKVDAKGLAPLDLSTSREPAVGAWLATVGTLRDPVAVGVVSVGERAIPPQAGILGVLLDPGNRPIVIRVLPDSGAAKAGVKTNDRITQVDGADMRTREGLIALVRKRNPGDQVELTIERDGKTLTLRATLGGNFPGIPMGRSEFQNSLGGHLSVRRYGFPKAIQHDTVLRPEDCGGPVVDVDGHVVGFNIARAGRTESYAVPTAAVNEVLTQLMAQGLSTPVKVERPAAESPTAPSSAVTTPTAAQK